ncbi:IS2 repressor TnpA [Magnetospirillum gryphiswaldense MSR-1]|nr:IS2 repressor TnpA [Magnetospirillum gryphiswaldense MSR-1]AVM76819.1 IS2 repressor TnpA [Magnetospirillum gryphiswaldense]
MDRNSTGRRRNRSWPEDLKREIVAATYEPGASVAGVARRYGVNDNQVFTWRKRFGGQQGETVPAHMVPVVVAEDMAASGRKEASSSAGVVEIDLAGGYRGDDTTVPVLAKGKTDTGRCWVYVRDDRPFGGPAPPAAMFYYSRDRRGEHPQAHLAGYAGLLQADAYGGYGALYLPDRKPGPILEAACWAHARRPFFALADLAANARRKAEGRAASVISPLALEAVRRIDALFEIERAISGQDADRRRAIRQELSAPLVADLERWLTEKRAGLSRGNDLAKAMDYMLKRWPAFTRFLDDGRVCMTNNSAERALRGIALGRKSWLFAGSDRGGQRAASMYSLIVTAKMNDIDPQAWLADVLARIAGHPASRIDELLPWNWRNANPASAVAA